MLNIERLIQKSVDNPKYLSYWLESFINEKISDVRSSLQEPMIWENNLYIIEDIKSLLKNYNKKQNIIKSLFYSIFAIEETNNIEKQLKILFDKLNTDRYKIETKYKTIKEEKKKISNMLNTLKILRIEFTKYQNNDFYLNEIDDKMILIKNYYTALLLKEKNLLEIKRLYNIIKTKG